jgi:L-lysine exporter family protein LysE/ArgO
MLSKFLKGRVTQMFQAISHGFLLALGLILPLGAQNVFVFNQGANHKHFISTLPVIITAGLCDSVLILLAVLGVSLILISLPMLQLVIFLVGFIFLLYIARSLWREQPADLKSQPPMSAKKQISFTLSVSLLNPHAIMDTIGVIGTSSTLYQGLDKWLFTFATISVSWFWFILLAIIGKVIGHLDKTGKYIILLNKISSLIILIVACIIVKNMIQLIIKI